MTDKHTGGHTAGQFAVFEEWSHRWATGEITRVTPMKVMTRRHGPREAYHDKSSIVFSGPETDARALCEVLTSLEGRRTAAVRQLADQHRERIKSAIAKATGASQ
ncbi:hypothetical protein UFOVP679_18 [uncultured Caudovirales phage]|uniref:Uncharacterized protein n=1 Tax=uncultured Caudovirales phage TaxID=2100421 RepID=A0A6J5NHY5_9CAUD|nr:hypothetical protein UFOVP679_18 [uncultured Caudovirales phage]